MLDETTFWMIWSPNRGVPRTKYPTEVTARAEAERLAEENHGCDFVVLVSIGHAVKPAPKPTWITHLPF